MKKLVVVAGTDQERSAARRTPEAGQDVIRGWLIQCAWVSVQPGRDATLRAIFERLAPKIGKKRAIVAVARRLAVRLRARWLEVVTAQPLAA
jgi:hypothetical protein